MSIYIYIYVLSVRDQRHGTWPFHDVPVRRIYPSTLASDRASASAAPAHRSICRYPETLGRLWAECLIDMSMSL